MKLKVADARTVVITGMGVTCSTGESLSGFRQALREGRHGLSELEGIPVSRNNSLAAQMKTVPLSRPGRLRRIARSAAAEALAAAGIVSGGPIARRTGLYLATVSGDSHTAERLLGADPEPENVTRRYRLAILTFPAGVLADRLARDFGLEGPRHVNSNACASGLIALAAATWAIRTGRLDIALVCGADQLKPITYYGADRSGIIGPSVRPFHRLRNGTVFGDGAGAVVVEAADHALARGAMPLVEVAGIGLGCSDDPHEIIPQLEGTGIARCIAAALTDARLDHNAIGYVNCHASGTVNIDLSEYAAIRKAFTTRTGDVYVSATKSFTGHLSSASAIIELAVSVDATSTGFLPETLGLDDPDPAIPLRHVPAGGITIAPGPVLSLSMGGGGVNTAAVLKPWLGPVAALPRPALDPATPALAAAVVISERPPQVPGQSPNAFSRNTLVTWRPVADLDVLSGGESNAHYNRAARLALAAATDLVNLAGLSDEELRSERLALVIATSLGGTATWSDLLARTYAENPRHITPSMALSHGAHLGATLTARAFRIVGPTVTLVGSDTAGLGALTFVSDMAALGLIDRAIVVGVDIADEATCRGRRLVGNTQPVEDAAVALLVEVTGQAAGKGRAALARLVAVEEAAGAPGATQTDDSAARVTLASVLQASEGIVVVDATAPSPNGATLGSPLSAIGACGAARPLAALVAAAAEIACGAVKVRGYAVVASATGGTGAAAMIITGGA